MTVNAAAELAPHGTADRLPSQTIVPRRIPSDPSPARAMLQRGPKGPESLLPLECSSGHRDFQLTKSLNINRLKTACCEEVEWSGTGNSKRSCSGSTRLGTLEMRRRSPS